MGRKKLYHTDEELKTAVKEINQRATEKRVKKLKFDNIVSKLTQKFDKEELERITTILSEFTSNN